MRANFSILKPLACTLVALGYASIAVGAPMVGAYYYPWWGAGVGGHSFNQSLRGHLLPNPQWPAAGVHNSRSPNVIAAHLDQSHLGNISMWSLSWWGPNTFEDTTIQQHILPHPRAAELKYSIHYETTGRLGSLTNPNYANLLPDFQYLAEHVWSNPNYLRIDGRPVLIMYLTREYFKTQDSWDTLAQARATIAQQFGYDPFIIGDDFFGFTPVNVARATQFDAITDFDVYGTAFGDGIVTQARVNTLATIYANAKTAANNVGVAFVPTVSPGFNDTGVRSGHSPAARYLSELGPQAEGSLMESMLKVAVLPHTDPSVLDLVMVNSFNEWHEDTQIEASILAPATNIDNSTSGSAYTMGRYYEGYGNRYLEMLRAATVVAGDYDGNGIVEEADYLAWRASYGRVGSNLITDGDLDGKVNALDYIVWRSALEASRGDSENQSLPEPSAALIVIIYSIAVLLWQSTRSPR